MLRSFLIGLVAGQRAMTPLAAVTTAAAAGKLPTDSAAPRLLGHPLAAVGALALAGGELYGDKMAFAPDRIVPVGLVARGLTGAIAGAALADRGRWKTGAAIGAAASLASSYVGWRARCAAMRRWGQVPTGLVEDALVVGGAAAIVGSAA